MPRDVNIEMVTKIVPVRAVDLSIGRFCTEFRCERFCDDDVFGIGVEKVRKGSNRFNRFEPNRKPRTGKPQQVRTGLTTTGSTRFEGGAEHP